MRLYRAGKDLPGLANASAARSILVSGSLGRLVASLQGGIFLLDASFSGSFGQLDRFGGETVRVRYLSEHEVIFLDFFFFFSSSPWDIHFTDGLSLQ